MNENQSNSNCPKVTRTDTLLGSTKVILGNKTADLVLETLGKVYIKSGRKLQLLSEVIKEIMQTPNISESEDKIIITDNIENISYPGNGYFIYSKRTQTLYISVDSTYVALLEGGKASSVIGEYVKKTGDTMSGQLKFTTSRPNLIISNNNLIENLNSEYLEGHSAEEFAQKSRDEQISGKWTFEKDTTFKNNVIVEQDLTSPKFASGFSGYGWRLDSATNTLTIDNLVVRKVMMVYEMVINKIRATNGSLWISNSSKIDKVYRVPTLSELGYVIPENEYYFSRTTSANVYIHSSNELAESTTICYVPSSIYLNGSPTALTDMDKIQDSGFNINVDGKIGFLYTYYKYFASKYYPIVNCYIIDTDPDEYPLFSTGDILRCQKYINGQIKYYDALVLQQLGERKYLIQCSESIFDKYTKDFKEHYNTTLYQRTNPNYDGENDFPTNPTVGDDLIHIGNIFDTDRQGAIYLTSTDDQGPYIDVLDGINRPDYSVLYNTSPVEDAELLSSALSVGDPIIVNLSGYDCYISLEYSELSFPTPFTVYLNSNNSEYSLTSIPGWTKFVVYATEINKDGATDDYFTSQYIKCTEQVTPGTLLEYNGNYLTKNSSFPGVTTPITLWINHDNSACSDTYVDAWIETEVYKVSFLNTAISTNRNQLIQCSSEVIDDTEEESKDTYSMPTKVRLGKLDGIYDPIFGDKQPNGYGLYGSNVFLTGEFYLNNGKSVVEFTEESIKLAVGDTGTLVSRIEVLENNITAVSGKVDDIEGDVESAQTLLNTIDNNYVKKGDLSEYVTEGDLKTSGMVLTDEGIVIWGDKMAIATTEDELEGDSDPTALFSNGKIQAKFIDVDTLEVDKLIANGEEVTKFITMTYTELGDSVGVVYDVLGLNVENGYAESNSKLWIGNESKLYLKRSDSTLIYTYDGNTDIGPIVYTGLPPTIYPIEVKSVCNSIAFNKYGSEYSCNITTIRNKYKTVTINSLNKGEIITYWPSGSVMNCKIFKFNDDQVTGCVEYFFDDNKCTVNNVNDGYSVVDGLQWRKRIDYFKEESEYNIIADKYYTDTVPGIIVPNTRVSGTNVGGTNIPFYSIFTKYGLATSTDTISTLFTAIKNNVNNTDFILDLRNYITQFVTTDRNTSPFARCLYIAGANTIKLADGEVSPQYYAYKIDSASDDLLKELHNNIYNLASSSTPTSLSTFIDLLMDFGSEGIIITEYKNNSENNPTSTQISLCLITASDEIGDTDNYCYMKDKISFTWRQDINNPITPVE